MRNKNNNSLKYLSLAIAMALPLVSNATTKEVLNSQFKNAYTAYQDATDKNDKAAQLTYAKEAYQLGKQVYGDSNINTANLALILARQYVEHKKKRKITKSLLLHSLEIFQKEYSDNSANIAEVYMLLGQSLAYRHKKEAITYYKNALTIADEYEVKNPYYRAQVQLEAGIGLLHRGSTASRAILDAQEFYTERLPANDNRVVSANFFAGKYYLARNKYDKAIVNWNLNIPIFNSLQGATHPLELNTRAFLINALETKGKSEEATKHCIAIGAMTPWDDNQEQQPLFRIQPKYPEKYARLGKSGWVKIGFTISDFGTVMEAKVIESQGGRGFEKSALAALDKWRYAPKFENKQPIESYSTVQLDFKMN